MWSIEYHNDVGPDDDAFWEWWTVSDGERTFRSDDEEDAEWLAERLRREDEQLVLDGVKRRV